MKKSVKCWEMQKEIKTLSIHRLRIVTDMNDTSMLTRAHVHSCVYVRVSPQGKGGRELD